MNIGWEKPEENGSNGSVDLNGYATEEFVKDEIENIKKQPFTDMSDSLGWTTKTLKQGDRLNNYVSQCNQKELAKRCWGCNFTYANRGIDTTETSRRLMKRGEEGLDGEKG